MVREGFKFQIDHPDVAACFRCGAPAVLSVAAGRSKRRVWRVECLSCGRSESTVDKSPDRLLRQWRERGERDGAGEEAGPGVG